MRISRVVVKNFRSFEKIDIDINENTTAIIGENNTGKSNLLHAIRLCIDANLSSSYRNLSPSDIHSSVDISHPSQVLIGLEITEFAGNINEEALVGSWQHVTDRARLFYRYRPKLAVREDLEAETIAPGQLTREDYHWEIAGGGDGATDLADIEWDDDIGSAIRFSDLQSFLVFPLPALRDVESDLRQFKGSPLTRLIEATEIGNDEQEALVAALRTANREISSAHTVQQLAQSIDRSFKSVSGPAFSMDVGLGLAEPSFQAIMRALRVMLSNIAVSNFDPSSNGLGLNNILYVAILFEYFQRRLDQQKSAGQIILLEEPEAHLHPQLQLTLYKALSELPFQSIVTTHSTHITANAPLNSYVVLSQTGGPGIVASTPASNPDLQSGESDDLERYLDATRSNLLYARKVILVEGPAELFLIPPLLQQVLEIDLEREGVSVIPIFGIHFDCYTKLFGASGMPKKCAIITDGDLKPSDSDAEIDIEDDLPPPPDLANLESDHVHVFMCRTTFERALVLEGTVEMFALAAADVGAPRIAQRLTDGLNCLTGGSMSQVEKDQLLRSLKETVLRTATRVGKSRFAQITARHAGKATQLPKYITDAAEWITSE